ncbi:MAG: hypothetical protein JO353_05790 [Phycisphaerae bacterium]|nr:hypothetical protein [Phycisphaerae bacterium]
MTATTVFLDSNEAEFNLIAGGVPPVSTFGDTPLNATPSTHGLSAAEQTTRVARMLALAAALALPCVAPTASRAQDAAKPATPAADASAGATPAAPAATPAAETPAIVPPPNISPEAATTPSTVTPELKTMVDNFWHFGKIARYDLATAEGSKILGAGQQPQDVLGAFEMAANSRGDNLDQWLLRWQNIDAMKDVTAKLVAVLNQGYIARSGNPDAIKTNIDRLTHSERAYLNAIERLRASGELAVPFMVDDLRDHSKLQMQGTIRRALVDLGREALNPLVAATEMKDYDTLPIVLTVLGDLGYRDAIPYLARVATSDNLPPTVKSAARDAINRIQSNGAGEGYADGSPGDLFYELGAHIYYETGAIKADKRKPVSYIWFWSDDKGLTKLDVPNSIFADLMTMRSMEYALSLNSTKDAQALWLIANYKREIDLPGGQKDPTRADNQPSAHFYGVDSGPRYLNEALTRALKDHASSVAMKIIGSLQEIAGEPSALPDASAPLLKAMQAPDRLVRYESAFAIAGAMPQKQFQGSERVVPLLAEAMAQTGQTSVLLLASKQDQFNSLTEGLKGAGFLITGGTSADAALAASNAVPAVDVVLTSDDVPADEVNKLFDLLNGSPRLSGVTKLVMVKTEASPYAQKAATDSSLTTTLAKDAAGLKPAIDDARKKAGLPSDADTATKYALRAGGLLKDIAIAHNPVLDIAPAKETLLALLNDQRPDIVKLAGNVLALINDKDAQSGLLTVASNEKTADDVKISLYKSLADNAKLFGDQVNSSQLDPLNKMVASANNNDVRSAAAEAHGALNLPSDQAKGLILDQMKK